MKTVINDISFEYMFSSREEAISAFHDWLDICKEMSHEKVRRVQEFYGNSMNTSLEIAPNYRIIQLIQEFKDREDRRRLLGILLNSRSYEVNDNSKVYINKKEFKAGAFAYDNGILISLCSDLLFENDKIEAEYEEGKIEIDNLSRKNHIQTHSEKLGIRYYEHNKKHGKRSYLRSGGVVASEMDVTLEEAQQILNGAIEINGHLYGYYNCSFYEFKKTEKNIYHGYKNTELPKELKNKIIQNYEKGK